MASEPPLLSERAVGDLVAHLIASGRVDAVPTTDGAAFVTTAALRAEVAGAVAARGGRAQLRDLSADLGVDGAHVAAAADALAAGGVPGLRRLPSGELLSPAYFDGVAEDAAEAVVGGGGVLPLGAFSERLQLPVELLSAALEERLKKGSGGAGTGPLTTIGAELRAGLLVTPAYASRQARAVAGALVGVTRPTPLAAVASEIEAALAEAARGAAALEAAGGAAGGIALPLGTGPPPLDARAVEDAVKQRAGGGFPLPGALKGKVWVPDVHGAAQRAAVEGFLAANGYLPLARAARLGVPDPAALLSRHHPDLLSLPTAVALPGLLLAGPAAAMEDAAGCGSWLHVASMFPPDFGADDVAVLLFSDAESRSGAPPPGGAVKAGASPASPALASAALAGMGVALAHAA
jgi:hypothetical protein